MSVYCMRDGSWKTNLATYRKWQRFFDYPSRIADDVFTMHCDFDPSPVCGTTMHDKVRQE